MVDTDQMCMPHLMDWRDVWISETELVHRMHHIGCPSLYLSTEVSSNQITKCMVSVNTFG